MDRAEPEFAQRVRALFDAHRHKTIATLRADGSRGSPGIEAVFENGEIDVCVRCRTPARARSPSGSAVRPHTARRFDPVEGSEAQWPGEAKISGRAVAAGPVTDGSDGDQFHADIADVVHVHLDAAATMLVVEWWSPMDGLRRIERE